MTLGFISVRYKSANTAEFVDIGQIIAYDPYNKTYGEGGTPAIFAGAPDIDYRKISRLIAEEVAKIPKVEYKEPDLRPVSQALQALSNEIRVIDIPKPKPTDLEPVMAKIEAVE